MEKTFPKPTGEYAVGTFTYTVKDVREEVLPAGGMRSVAARVYYPVSKENVEGLSKTVALSEHMLEGFRKSFHLAPDFTKNPEKICLSGGFCENPCFIESLEQYCEVLPLGSFVLVDGLYEA